MDLKMLKSQKNQTLLFIVIISILSLILLPKISHINSEEKSNTPVVLICIDAADWKIINPLVERGYLPHFKELKKNGVAKNLTTLSSFSPLEWTIIASGRTKRSINVKEWIDSSGQLIDSQDVESKRLWDILSERGRKVGVYNWLLTWPPEEVNGFMISGALTRSEDNFYPKKLKENLKDRGFEINTGEYQNISLPLLEHLLHKFELDFLAIGDRYSYHVLSKNWGYWNPYNDTKTNISENKREIAKNKIIKSYKLLDKAIGAIKDHYNDEVNIIVVSDHGFHPTERSRTAAFKHLTTRYFSGRIRPEKIAQEIDLGSNQINFTIPGDVNPKEIKNQLEKIKTDQEKRFFDLVEISNNGDNNKKIVTNFYLRKNLLGKKKNKLGVLEYINLTIPFSKGKPRVYKLRIWSDFIHHDLNDDGIFIAEGPAFEGLDLHKKDNLSTLDISPTVLSILNKEIPESMKGKSIMSQ